MCQACDTPEMREQVRETLTTVGIESATVDRAILALTRPVLDESDGRWTDPSEGGTITLTKGQSFTLFAAMLDQVKSAVGSAQQAVMMNKMMGVPVDAIIDVAEGNKMLAYALDILDLLATAEGTEAAVAAVTIPDDASALVGEGDGSTT